MNLIFKYPMLLSMGIALLFSSSGQAGQRQLSKLKDLACTSSLSANQYSGRRGDLSSDLLLRLNERLSLFIESPSHSIEAFELGADFSPLADRLTKILQGEQDISRHALFQDMRQELVLELAEIAEKMPYLKVVDLSKRVAVLIEAAQNYDGINKPILHFSGGQDFVEFAREVFNHYDVLMLPTISHFSKTDSIHSWNSGVFQFGIMQRAAQYLKNNGTSLHAVELKFPGHDLSHIRPFVQGDWHSSSLTRKDRLRWFHRNIIIANSLLQSLEGLTPSLKTAITEHLFYIGHEYAENLSIYSVQNWVKNIPPKSELDRLAMLENPDTAKKLSWSEYKTFLVWWKNLPNVLL